MALDPALALNAADNDGPMTGTPRPLTWDQRMAQEATRERHNPAATLRWTSAAKNIESSVRNAQDLAAAIADDQSQSDEVREIFSALYSALRQARTQSFNAQVALGLQDGASA